MFYSTGPKDLWKSPVIRSEVVDHRKHPEHYRIGRGEQGVLTIEPYKSELLPHWRFKTPAEAKRSAAKLYSMFLQYLRDDDFVGADMARKFIQMGWTRSRRYANHPGGRKYKPGSREVLPQQIDPIKTRSAELFMVKLRKVKTNAKYRSLFRAHQTGIKSGSSARSREGAKMREVKSEKPRNR